MKIPKLISAANENSWVHVFLVVNPIAASVSRLIKETYQLNESNILTVSLRETDLSIMEFNPMYLNDSLINKILLKFFNIHTNTKKVLKRIGKIKIYFVHFMGL